ncbi:MAG: Hsp20/alpha crystallin family protein [Myxococcota bacterium]
MFYNYYTLQDHLLNRFRNRMLDLFEESETRDFSSWPPTNIYDEEDGLIMETVLPGVKDKDIELNVHDNVITLSGERKLNYPENSQLHRRERPVSKFSRSFKLPYNIKTDKIKANLKDGVLTVELPKHPQEKTKKISIKAS